MSAAVKSSAVEASAAASARGWQPLVQLWRFVRPHRAMLMLALIALVIAAVSALVLPVAVRQMIDLGFSRSNAAHIDRYFLLLFAVAVVLGLFTAARFYLVSWLGERVVAD